MSIRNGHSRKVSFDIKEDLGDKIDKLAVVIGKLATRDSRTGRQFTPQICQNRGRGHNRSSIAIRAGIYQIVVSEDKTEVSLDTNKIIGEETSEETWGALTDRVAEDRIRTITEMTGMIEAGTGLVRGHFLETITTI